MANPSWSKAKYAARGVHLDQDTAGRLLESMGDYARREMIVRIAKTIRQNPAYRPFANTSDNLRSSWSEVVLFFQTQYLKRTLIVRLQLAHRLLIPVSVIGCVSTQPKPTGIPTPTPSAVPSPIPGGPSSWTFSLTPGTAAYRISRSATIEAVSDSAGRKEVSTNTTYESITLLSAGDTISFSAVADTFSTITQGLAGSAQTGQAPSHVSGSLIGDSLVVSRDSLAEGCNPIASALVTDIHNLIPRFPPSLSPAQAWMDSTHLAGCQGSIPTRSRLLRYFKVIGLSTYENVSVLVVQRNDSISAEGEGAQQQHRIQLNASGTGGGIYYLDINTGRILHLTVSQELNLTIAASGRVNHFRQSAKQDFALVR